MEKFYRQIVNHSKAIITVYVILFVVCFICNGFVSVNYDMNDYLPPDSPSTIAIDVLNEEFEGGIPNARVMVQNVSLAQGLEYKGKIEAIDGVISVTWLDDAVSLEVPLETQDTETVENYYKDNNALYSVTIDEDKRIETVDAIRELIGDENQMTGSAVATAVATTSTVEEIYKIAAFAVIFVICVLLLTTNSWIEPFIVLAGLGVAIVINAGSNIIFGEVSFVTNAAGNILQLAVSLDYSVFLIHRFTECRKQYSDVKEAMVKALCMSTSSILSSGLTTVIGFLALCLMQFKIGPDLGRALAKGIAISLITVFTLMPAIILYTYKWIDKTTHKPLMPSFEKFGKFVTKIMVPLVVVFAIVIIPAYRASNSNSFYYGDSHIFGTDTQLGADTAAIEETFGKSDTYVLMIPNTDKAVQKQISDELHSIKEISGILSYVDTVGMEIPESYLDSKTLSLLVSDNCTRLVLTVKSDYEGEETFAVVSKIREIAEKYYPGEWYLAGSGVSAYDLMDTITADMTKVNLVAIGAVFVVLLVTMKSIILPVILVLSIETAIWLNMSIPYFAGNTIFYIAYLIISSIQLGATVDYAILMTDRYRENRATMGRKDAVVATISSTTVSILTSGITLTVVGFLLGKISTHGLLSQLGYFLGKGTLLSMGIVFFVLPGLLYLFDATFTGERKLKLKKSKEPVAE
jgi:predicted RND superfamily exporter protein